MKIAILGGTFNPIHIGHLALADDVCITFGYDRMLFIPAFCPPHKEMNDAESGDDRFAMTELACNMDSRFKADDCELKRGGVSYTYDTVCFLEKKYASDLEGKIGLVMGQDLAAEFYKWYRADELAEKTDIILARRPPVFADGSMKAFENKPSGAYTGKPAMENDMREFPFPHVLLRNPLLPVSSTDIRARIAGNESWQYLVPAPVYRYIRERRLYGYAE